MKRLTELQIAKKINKITGGKFTAYSMTYHYYSAGGKGYNFYLHYEGGNCICAPNQELALQELERRFNNDPNAN